ncbi:MAG: Response regulator receiver protein [Parcubacteria group bacterium GW2011_GWA1_60_11]|nr:MAG: Response regulator receiver protein [Parcubacteria group bacterium GW2011_GWA1_60_11]
MRIVIVEDEIALVKVLGEKFKREGFDVSVATNGEDAVRVIRSQEPDLVLLDLILPKKDGFAVLSELAGKKATIPVVVLSNLGQAEDERKAKELGAVDYLVKTQHPINEVVEKVRGHLMSRSK